MYEDEILREVWRVKDKLAREYERDPKAYWEKLRQIGQEWKKQAKGSGRRKVIKRSRKRVAKKV
jgi:hypothetical protein